VPASSAAAQPLPPRAAQVKLAERASGALPKKLNVQAAPIRQYLVRAVSPSVGPGARPPWGRRAERYPAAPQEATVVPVLMQGLQALCKERPENPVEYLAAYLLAHNPQPPSKPSAAAPMDTSS
jgi:protein dpy-30